MKTRCVVVVGHVDHGKTALVHALTGIETDRLAEEKARGLSITAGFAHATYPTGTVDFIDAPGHEDFIQAMIGAASGAGAALVVVSATEGIGAQTLEHLCIAGLLDITRGVIAISKSDLLPASEQAARLAELRADLSRTPLANAPMILCSAHGGAGLDDLHAALQALLEEATATPATPHCFLPIDRVFSMPGRGTIVTGTLLGDDLAVGDAVVLLPTGRTATIRGLQSRGKDRDRVHAGERMAANLRGVAVDDIARGSVLCVGDAAAPATCMDVHLNLLPTATLKHMDTARVSFGTASATAQVRLFGGGQRAPEGAGYGQLRFNKPMVGYAGQRAILRRLSPAQTIGGAMFLDPQAMPTGSSDKGRLQVLEAVHKGEAKQIANTLAQTQDGVAQLTDVARLARLTVTETLAALTDTFETLGAGMIASRTYIETCKAKVLNALTTYHATHPLHAMAPHRALGTSTMAPALLQHIEYALQATREIHRQDGKLALSGHDPIALLSKDQHARMADIEAAFHDAMLSPPATDSVVQAALDHELFALLIDTGRLIALRNVSLKQTLVFHADTLTAATATLTATFPPPQTFTTSEARSALATSRRVIVPLLEHFDTRGLTIRHGNARQMARTNLIPQVPPVG